MTPNKPVRTGVINDGKGLPASTLKVPMPAVKPPAPPKPDNR